MAYAPQPDARFTSTSVHGNPGVLSSGMFAGAQNFTVTGRTLQNIINNYTSASERCDFRMFPLGDVDLQREIRLHNGTGTVSRREKLVKRRVYSAKLHGQNVTVAMYPGDGAEEEWQQHIAAYRALRHPNILQIYGAVSSDAIHATVFHDDLIPLEHFMDLYKDCPSGLVYIRALYGSDLMGARNYLDSIPVRRTVGSVFTSYINVPIMLV
ncbi:hypothetical protein DFH06DRAFT_1173065 [Mycena polygramma]|nr:hypothetical protein DFH06DRAFT_1173065 [Mycena polygramma]